MKSMRKYIVVLIITACCKNAVAQTNTFPTTGNVGIGTTNPGSLPFGGGGLFSVYNPNAASMWLGGNIFSLDGQGTSKDLTFYFRYSNTATILFDSYLRMQHNSNEVFRFGSSINTSYSNLISPFFGNISPNAGEVVRAEKNNAGYYVADFKNTSTNGYGVRIWNGNDANDAFRISNAAGTADVITMFGNGKANFTGNIIVQNNTQIGIDGTYGSGYGVIGFGGNSNGFNRVFGRNNGTDDGLFLASATGRGVFFRPNGSNVDAMVVAANYNVGIGTTSPTEKLSVNGNIKAKKLIVSQVGWPDYVFSKNYKLRPLTEVDQFIKTNKHLPDMPSAKEVENKGLDVGNAQALLLKKIEELTLYVIQLNKELQEERAINRMQEKVIKRINQ
jgi:hypothetical protein